MRASSVLGVLVDGTAVELSFEGKGWPSPLRMGRSMCRAIDAFSSAVWEATALKGWAERPKSEGVSVKWVISPSINCQTCCGVVSG